MGIARTNIQPILICIATSTMIANYFSLFDCIRWWCTTVERSNGAHVGCTVRWRKAGRYVASTRCQYPLDWQRTLVLTCVCLLFNRLLWRYGSSGLFERYPHAVLLLSLFHFFELQSGSTALIRSFRRPDLAILERLLAYKADVRHRNDVNSYYVGRFTQCYL